MSSQRQLFGTDGIRGVAGEFPLTRESTFIIGRALGISLKKLNAEPRVVIGQDTRESSVWIADRVALGLQSQGVQVVSAGVITTPGIAYLARSRGFDAGVVISASHNPWTDNGIKVFSGDGYKLPDARELEIEREIFAELQSHAEIVPDTAWGSLPGREELRRSYIQWLAGNISADLSSLRVLTDCANGAAAAEAPELFRLLGVQADFVHLSPDGKNINAGCGALHPEALAQAMTARGTFDLGVTFDGDADRALLCDAEGNIVNGDAVLLLCARDMQARGCLAHSTVVATTMSNMGLEIALRRSGIRLLRANVGDKYVLEEMRSSGATLGGEQSGHIIFLDGEATTGDGLLTALRVMQVVKNSGQGLGALVSGLKVFPQVIQNIRVREKVPLSSVPEIQRAMQAAEGELDGNGRVVVRYSGTEPLARVMVEAEDEPTMRRIADSISAAIRNHLAS